ncbi:Hypothetical predicted protein [Cloeon dipterum]|uniref:Uncharacterized protein n=1 Tax=Cloeon dipterum TaxID=197152 RepID=A0A8S1DIE7_9INSE|nr:Hypothetical predicted protein [Cloeon dipterum]
MEESDPESSLESDSNQERQKVPDSPYYFGQTNSTLIPDRVRLKNLSKEIDAMLKTLAKMKKELKVKRNRRRRAGPSQKNRKLRPRRGRLRIEKSCWTIDRTKLPASRRKFRFRRMQTKEGIECVKLERKYISKNKRCKQDKIGTWVPIHRMTIEII